jgi:hypothetical protein
VDEEALSAAGSRLVRAGILLGLLVLLGRRKGALFVDVVLLRLLVRVEEHDVFSFLFVDG